MSSAPKIRPFLLDACRSKYSWAAGVRRGTPSAIERHQRDLEIAFAEINGLIAGLHYQDRAECRSAQVASPFSHSQNSAGGAADAGLFHTPTPQYPTDILDEDLEHLPTAVDRHVSSASEHILGAEDQPMASQWAAIRSLREETAFHHQRFQQISHDLADPTVSKLLEIYPDAQSIRNRGAQLVKDVLDGFRPRELSLVFAFTSFTYAISQLLHKKGRLAKHEILADLNIWRGLISDRRERQAFDLIAQRLWPEAKEHLHFFDTPDAAQSRDRRAPFPDLSSTAVKVTGPAIPGFPDFPACGQATGNHSPFHHPMGQFPFSDGGSCPDQQAAISSETAGIHPTHLMATSNETFDYAALLGCGLSNLNDLFLHPPAEPGGGPLAPGNIGSLGNTLRQEDALGASAEGSEQLRLIKPEPKEVKLDETRMFLAVLVFLQDITELVYILSGRSLASRRQKLYKAEERDQEAFYKSVQETFFKPLYRRRDLTTPAFWALLSVADKFTQSGLLRSIEEIRHYLVSVASVSKKALTWIAHCTPC